MNEIRNIGCVIIRKALIEEKNWVQMKQYLGIHTNPMWVYLNNDILEPNINHKHNFYNIVHVNLLV